ncbi:hypothetical protein F7731_25965 [Cytobacillus depressus]|uniref:Uncharacterized protein n=1 Tax=Cytobacillus depressus TaxID=1602942 RepID=A0A6L3UYL4_9BACI|nr:hypothetical protein [Cytobacillus depressus]KAB2328176.1 hypothetical protein F7731_25965 [Cytobacillus depressus]
MFEEQVVTYIKQENIKKEISEGLKKQGDQGSKGVTPGMCDAHEDGTSAADAEIRRLFKAEAEHGS